MNESEAKRQTTSFESCLHGHDRMDPERYNQSTHLIRPSILVSGDANGTAPESKELSEEESI